MAIHQELSDNELFDEVLRQRARGEDPGDLLGTLCERWRRPAGVVIQRIQASYRVEAPDDEPEFFHDAVQRLLERGLDQYRGVSELPGKSASPKTFFLRIVKHLVIDRYRQKRELLDPGSTEEDEASPYASHEATVAIDRDHRQASRQDAQELYWKAFQRLQAEHPSEAAAWDVYHHQDVEDHNECARILSITVANSYKRISRAQAYLRRYLLELIEGENA